MHAALLRPITAAVWLTIAPPCFASSETRNVPSLLDMIELWLVANYDLTPSGEPPLLTTVSARRLIEIRYGPASTVAPGDVVAAYDEHTATIYLTNGWTGRDVAEMSVLVHEMVHHLQAAADIRFACPAQRELLAYEAQDAWLRLFGSSLSTAFGIDETMLLVGTVCTH